ncbi:MAG TPA: recombinase family protein [Roseobacter sp.]|uniref:Resolvase/invertase-type recombinase catalytic domain-containing protein n=1 Tax=marine sediment metagenome TaxID=412755 RepID=A0A0F9LAU2_9ZZZZ|nr:recombinase family protein [Roseobacter sp.]
MADKSKNEPRKIGYARVSTADQNLAMQVDALKRYGVQEEYIFTDKMSGKSQSRPGLTKALKTAQHSDSEFVVWKLDRLGRSLLGILDTVQLFSDRGVRLVSLTEGLDLGTPMGRMILHIMASLAEYERELIRERTMAGLRQAKEDGRAHGRPASMTDERCQKAADMLTDGAHVVKEILPALQKLAGPPIKRAALYKWVQDHKAATPPEESTDDR